MNIRCCLCGGWGQEEAFLVTTSEGPQLISFCSSCRKPPVGYKPLKINTIIRGYCPHGEPITSKRKDARHTYNCPECVTGYYRIEAVRRNKAFHDATGVWRNGRKQKKRRKQGG